LGVAGCGLAFPRPGVRPARHRLQQLACVLEVAAPQQRSPFAGQAISGICGNVIFGHFHPFGRRRARFRTPACRSFFAPFVPADDGKVDHCGEKGAWNNWQDGMI